MIIGIGSDIVDIKRIEKSINKFGQKFINKCFVEIEIDNSKNTINNWNSEQINQKSEECKLWWNKYKNQLQEFMMKKIITSTKQYYKK